MCEAHAYLVSEAGQEPIMENVVSLTYEGDEVVLADLFGDELRLRARVKEIALLDHRIYLEDVSDRS
jgi:predicted RNA-binding protein